MEKNPRICLGAGAGAGGCVFKQVKQDSAHVFWANSAGAETLCLSSRLFWALAILGPPTAADARVLLGKGLVLKRW